MNRAYNYNNTPPPFTFIFMYTKKETQQVSIKYISIVKSHDSLSLQDRIERSVIFSGRFFLMH